MRKFDVEIVCVVYGVSSLLAGKGSREEGIGQVSVSPCQSQIHRDGQSDYIPLHLSFLHMYTSHTHIYRLYTHTSLIPKSPQGAKWFNTTKRTSNVTF